MNISNLFKSKPQFATATDEIKHLLKSGRKISQQYCNNNGITTRLGSIIHELRKRHGMDIVTDLKLITTKYNEKTYIAIYYYNGK